MLVIRYQCIIKFLSTSVYMLVHYNDDEYLVDIWINICSSQFIDNKKMCFILKKQINANTTLSPIEYKRNVTIWSVCFSIIVMVGISFWFFYCYVIHITVSAYYFSIDISVCSYLIVVVDNNMSKWYQYNIPTQFLFLCR